MTTKLSKTFKREIELNGEPHTVAISRDGIKVTRKGFRFGTVLTWAQVLRLPSPGRAAADLRYAAEDTP